MGGHPSFNNFLVLKSQEVAGRLISDRSLGIAGTRHVPENLQKDLWPKLLKSG